ncbi:olfactory receptor 5AS1-like [Syngnathoides biaculeatus]|uniref:olfactory receptor 5AS1-like n=1 Tax=Syngnathoides biaculeatus TaxID=300417 RepID=UPI002ADD3778|nr:olfactory receptor 5AS1-like [Syngnathoides biaculeatus]
MNGTHALIVLGGYVDVDKYRYVYFVFLLILYVFIICCNCTIICVVWLHRNLHEPMYVFIAALSVNSLLFSTAIYPKLFVDVLSQRQTVSHAACMSQLFFFYTFATSDILLLSAMAYDRYVSICKPLQYATTMGPSTVTVFLVLAWFLPACQIAVATVLNAKQKMCTFVLKGIFCNTTVNMLHCVRSKILAAYGVLIFINTSLFPILFILYTYIQIFSVVHRRRSRVREKAAETCVPHLMVLICFCCLAAFDVAANKMESKLPRSFRVIMMLQIVVYNPLFNPIIYGVKMKEIWKHIKKLFARHGK